MSVTNTEMRGDPIGLDMLATVVRVLPRGRGAVPRLAGRILERYFDNTSVTTRYGSKLAVAPSSLDFFVTLKNWGGSREHWVHDSCRWVMPANGVFYDIGANVGYMNIELMHALPNASCVAFEPQAGLNRALSHSVTLNALTERMQVIKSALSDRSGTALLREFAHDGHATLVQPDAIETYSTGARSVRTLTLDQAIENYSFPVIGAS